LDIPSLTLLGNTKYAWACKNKSSELTANNTEPVLPTGVYQGMLQGRNKPVTAYSSTINGQNTLLMVETTDRITNQPPLFQGFWHNNVYLAALELDKSLQIKKGTTEPNSNLSAGTTIQMNVPYLATINPDGIVAKLAVTEDIIPGFSTSVSNGDMISEQNPRELGRQQIIIRPEISNLTTDVDIKRDTKPSITSEGKITSATITIGIVPAPSLSIKIERKKPSFWSRTKSFWKEKIGSAKTKIKRAVDATGIFLYDNGKKVGKFFKKAGHKVANGFRAVRDRINSANDAYMMKYWRRHPRYLQDSENSKNTAPGGQAIAPGQAPQPNEDAEMEELDRRLDAAIGEFARQIPFLEDSRRDLTNALNTTLQLITINETKKSMDALFETLSQVTPYLLSPIPSQTYPNSISETFQSCALEIESLRDSLTQKELSSAKYDDLSRTADLLLNMVEQLNSQAQRELADLDSKANVQFREATKSLPDAINSFRVDLNNLSTAIDLNKSFATAQLPAQPEPTMAEPAEQTSAKLILTIRYGYIDEVKNLIAQGADVNAKDSNGYTPLHWASINGYLDVAKLLV
jgi:Ankyrin repeats (3 copies)